MRSTKKLLTGPTGCGKTFESIRFARSAGKRIIYTAPCRQLVYETAIKYAHPDDTIVTGEVNINKNGSGDVFAVYEAIPNDRQDYFLIIDEAHHLIDKERGRPLMKMALDPKQDCLLCTATQTFRVPQDFKKINLKSRQRFTRKRVTTKDFFARVKAGEPSIIFHKYRGECGSLGGTEITAHTLPDERVKAQIAFARGDINLIECTNVLAQGLNFPATNILIIMNEYDSPETLLQKIGRLGRPGITKDHCVLTYAIAFPPYPDLPDEFEDVQLDYIPKLPKKINISKVEYAYDDKWDDLESVELYFRDHFASRVAEEKIDEMVRRTYNYFVGQPQHKVPDLWSLSDDWAYEQTIYAYDGLFVLSRIIAETLHGLSDTETQYVLGGVEETLCAGETAKLMVNYVESVERLKALLIDEIAKNELGDLQYGIEPMVAKSDLVKSMIQEAAECKAERVPQYLHHQVENHHGDA